MQIRWEVHLNRLIIKKKNRMNIWDKLNILNIWDTSVVPPVFLLRVVLINDLQISFFQQIRNN